MNVSEIAIHLTRLQRELAELVSSLPAHSIPPAMLIRIEDLETEIHQLQQILGVRPGDDKE